MADGALLVAKSPTTWPKRPKDASKISRFVKIESNPGRSLPSESAPSANLPNPDNFQSQILFLQEEHTHTIKKLHEEIERLQRKCADLIANLASEEKGDDSFADLYQSQISELNAEIKRCHAEITKLNDTIELKDQKIIHLEQRLIQCDHIQKEENKRRTDRIKALENDLKGKESAIMRLNTQLHQLRLRDAVERQKAAQTASKSPSVPSTTPPTPKKAVQTSPRMWRPPGTAPVPSPPQTAAARPYSRNRSAAGASSAAAGPGALLPPISGTQAIRPLSGSRSAVTTVLGPGVESVSIEKPNSGGVRRSSFRRSIGKDGGSGAGAAAGSSKPKVDVTKMKPKDEPKNV